MKENLSSTVLLRIEASTTPFLSNLLRRPWELPY